MKRVALLPTRSFAFAFALLAGCGLFGGDVEHPKPGESSSTEYCARAPAEEQNCMACASKPGCGWCVQQNQGAAPCQPGASDDTHSETCAAPLIISTEDCDAPPPVIDE
jgi:hypothetical protein